MVLERQWRKNIVIVKDDTEEMGTSDINELNQRQVWR